MNVTPNILRQTAFLASILVATLTVGVAFAQESERVESELYFQPNATQQFEVGDRITLVVHVKKPNETRAIGIATNLEIVEIETKVDHLKYTVKVQPEQNVKIEHAKNLNQLWFAGFKYDDKHDATIEQEIDIDEFLKENTEYRPCNERDWGYGGSGPRIEAPKFLVKTATDKTP